MSEISIRLTSWKRVCISVQNIDRPLIHIAWIKEIDFDCFSQKDVNVGYSGNILPRVGKLRNGPSFQTRSNKDARPKRQDAFRWTLGEMSIDYGVLGATITAEEPGLIMLCKIHLLFTVYLALSCVVIVSSQITCICQLTLFRFCRMNNIDQWNRPGHHHPPTHSQQLSAHGD